MRVKQTLKLPQDNTNSSKLYTKQATFLIADCAYGAGIAKQFKWRYGTEKVIGQNKQPGKCAVTKEEDSRIVFHLIAKEQCTDLPTYDYFRESLEHMRVWCVENKVKRVSVPRLRCGLDRLDFEKVQKILSEVFMDVDIEITIYFLYEEIHFIVL